MASELSAQCQIAAANVPFDDLGSMQTLLWIKVRWRFINQVDISWLAKTQRQRHSLQLASR